MARARRGAPERDGVKAAGREGILVEMECVARDLGVHTADAQRVRLTFDTDLRLTFVDWREVPRALTFRDVLAFRWEEFDECGIRDDSTYEVIDSPWLARQADLQGVPAADYRHYKLCFNACGVLDVLSRPVTLSEALPAAP